MLSAPQPLSRIVLLCVLSTFIFTISLQGQRSCGHDHLWAEMMKDPAFAKKYKQQRAKLIEISKRKSTACTTPLIIPVAVHYSGAITTANTTCLVDAALAQVEQLNKDFRSCNQNASVLCSWIESGCSAFGGTAGGEAMSLDGACIQFCLANQNLPAGEDNIGGYGITVGDYTWGDNGSITNWAGCMNIMVDSDLEGGNILGIATMGGGDPSSGNGFAVLASVFGGEGFAGCTSGADIGTSTIYSEGATATHEAGHYFALNHTFSDNLEDTPPQVEPNYGCPTVDVSNCTTSAGSPIDYSANFMDYVNDICMNNFSADQVTIMRNFAANQSSWATNMISCYDNWQNNILTYTACEMGPCQLVEEPPVANIITPTSIEICDNKMGVVQFYDGSTNAPTQWQWFFSGLSVYPEYSTQRNPNVIVAEGGTLTIKLLASNQFGVSDTATAQVTVNTLLATHQDCQVNPCLDFSSGPYVDLSYADGCMQGCQKRSGALAVWDNEAYVLADLQYGVTYKFEFCQGYDAVNNWPAVITVGEYDPNNAVAVPNSQIAVSQGCELSFTCPADGDYIVVISNANNCGGASTQINNGFPSIQCIAGCDATACGETFYDGGGEGLSYVNNESKEYTICPDNPECQYVELNFSAFNIEYEANCGYDVMEIYDGIGTQNAIGSYCGTNSPGTVASTDNSGCLTILFNSDSGVVGSGWRATVNCISNGQCDPCMASNTDMLILDGITKLPIRTTNSGPIESTQVIEDNTIVSYESGVSITMQQNFSIELGTTFEAEIRDNCLIKN